MAYPTEKYVTATAPGGGDGSLATPWTLAEALAANVPGNRVNVKSGAYPIAGFAMCAGTVLEPVLYRGYNTTIGDLDGQGRNSDGTLNTTNFPVITLTATIIPNGFSFLQNFVINGDLSTTIVTTLAVDNFGLVNCSLTNTKSDALLAGCVSCDNNCYFVNCDMACTGAAHTTLLLAGTSVHVIGCRLRVTANDKSLLACDSCIASRSVFIGPSAPGTSIAIDTGILAVALTPIAILGCTIQGFGTAINVRNVAQTGMPILIADNIVTGCTNYLVRVAGGNTTVIESNQRTRDNTNPRSATIIDVTLGKEVTTDTGGAESDYISLATGDLQLISSSPARRSGMMPNTDCGAFQSNLGGRIRSRPMRVGNKSV